MQVEVEVWANEFSDTRDAYDVRLSKFTKCGGRLIFTTCRWYYQIGLKKLYKVLEDPFGEIKWDARKGNYTLCSD